MHPHPPYAHLGGTSQGLLDATSVLHQAGLRRGDVLVDAGAGAGYLSLAAADLVGPEGRVYAIDVLAEAMAPLRDEVRRRKLANVALLVADLAGPIPLPDGTADLCLLASVLHDLVEEGVADRALEELARLLKPEGALTVVDFRPAGDPAVGPPPAIRLSPQEERALVEAHRFRLRTTFAAGPEHYGLIFAKEV